MRPRFTPGMLIVGRFRLEQPLGEGAYGEVWRATQLPVERSVAIKLLKPSSDHFARQRFDREARALAAINHPNCVQLFDFGHLPGDEGSFLVTELVTGQTLRSWMQQFQSIPDVVRVCQQIAEALAAAHHQQVLHRDLKPENVMISRDRQQGLVVKVLDFGLSKIVDDERRDITKTGEIFGTPGYMSPEQLRGQPIDSATDLYSFGVIMYELLQGRPPFTADTGHEVCMMHLTDEVPPITADVPPPLKHLAQRLLAKDARKRADAREVARVLGAVAAKVTPQAPVEPVEEATTQRHPGEELPTLKRVEPSRSRMWLTGGVIAACGLVSAVLLFRPRAERPPPPPVQSAPVVAPATPEPPVEPTRVDVGAPEAPVPAHAGCGREVEPGRIGIQRQDGLVVEEAPAYVPRGYDANVPHPLLIILHEELQSPIGLLNRGNFQQHADDHGFLLLAPDGDRRGSWDHPEQLERAWKMVVQMQQELCVDPDRIFVFGYGAGGYGAEHLACAFPIAAVATHAHRLTPDENLCEAKGPHPRLMISPLDDGWDPVDGGSRCPTGSPKITLEANEELLRERNHCSGKPRTIRKDEDGTCQEWDCEARLVTCHVKAGRPWPGMDIALDSCGGYATGKFGYEDALWDFITSP